MPFSREIYYEIQKHLTSYEDLYRFTKATLTRPGSIPKLPRWTECPAMSLQRLAEVGPVAEGKRYGVKEGYMFDSDITLFEYRRDGSIQAYVRRDAVEQASLAESVEDFAELLIIELGQRRQCGLWKKMCGHWLYFTVSEYWVRHPYSRLPFITMPNVPL